MKPKLDKCIRNPLRVRGFRSRAAALVACVAIGASTAARLDAVVVDDFEDPARSATLWTGDVWYGTGGQTLTNGQVRIYITPTGNHGFSFLKSVGTWTLQEGRTLEFRADLLSSNGDGAVAFFGFNTGDGGYRLMVDEDTVACHKRGGTQFFFVTNGAPVKVSNVKLVVSMTGAESGVLLKLKILDNDNGGAVIFERECRDTAAADPMQGGSDDPPESYLGTSGYFYVGLYRDNAATVDPDVTLPHLATGEVVFDNAEVLEYDVPSLQIANSVLLSWSGNTEEEQIVVATDSLTNAAWAPCPQPIFAGSGGMSMAVPTTASQQFFKLVPGTQFVDDFSDTWGPFTNRNSWQLIWNTPASEFLVTNGLLRINWHGPESGAFVALPLGTNVLLGDFSMSMDVLDWATSGTNWSTIAHVARGMFTGTYSGAGAGLTLNSPIPGRVTPWVGSGENGTVGVPFEIAQFPPPYRLVYCGVGTNFTFRVVNLTTKQLIRETIATYPFRSQGVMGIIVNAPAGVNESHNITVDNFLMNGTKP
jgi:hypothetical protein